LSLNIVVKQVKNVKKSCSVTKKDIKYQERERNTYLAKDCEERSIAA
jgi:hypothetical protein